MSGATKLLTAGGGGVNLTPASSIASDVTVNVPSQNCTLGIQGPAFSVYVGSNQSLSASTVTKLQYNTKTFDTATCYDTTNYRFTPNVAGYYQINLCQEYSNQTGLQAVNIYKNGGRVASGAYVNTAASGTGFSSTSVVVYLNGTTDYVEPYGYTQSATTAFNNSSSSFSGCLVRAA